MSRTRRCLCSCSSAPERCKIRAPALIAASGLREVMPEHGDELLAQFSGLAFGGETLLQCDLDLHQFAFVAPAGRPL